MAAVPLTQLQRVNSSNDWYSDLHKTFLEIVPFEQNTPEGNEVPAWGPDPTIPGAPRAPVAGCIFGGGTANFDNIVAHPYRRPHIGNASGNAGVDALQAQAARACDEFDDLPCTYDQGVTWGAKKLLALEHMWWLASKHPSNNLFRNRTVNGKNGAKLKTSIPSYFHACMAVAIVTYAYGPATAAMAGETLQNLVPLANPNQRNGGPEFQDASEIHGCFVKPLLFFAKEVLSKEHAYYNGAPILNIERVLHKTIGGKVFDDHRTKLQQGVWSEEWVSENHGDNDTCKGMYYPYARFLQLFDRNFGFKRGKGYMLALELTDLLLPITPTMTHNHL
jgi:hypothetical protein